MAGGVVGVCAAIALGLGALFLMRHRRHKKAVAENVAGGEQKAQAHEKEAADVPRELPTLVDGIPHEVACRL